MSDQALIATVPLPKLLKLGEQQTVDMQPLELSAGQLVFVLGANGTGKSSLLTYFVVQGGEKVRRISAHRQTSFQSSKIDITAAKRRSQDSAFRDFDRRSASRWHDSYAQERTQSALFDLVASESRRSQHIAAAVDANDLNAAKRRADTEEAAARKLNRLLKTASIDIEIILRGAEEVQARRQGYEPYGVHQMSDGQRAALLLAADVLTAPDGTIFLIDEPERHLHRSISSPLLRDLFAERPDCTFVVSTHEIDLAFEHPQATTLLIRSYFPAQQEVSDSGQFLPECWDMDIYNPSDAPEGLEDDLRRDILGARRRLLFVEGQPNSLDQPLYSLLFPNVSVIAKESCMEVQRAVAGLRSSSSLHWIEAYGIVDGDNRTDEDIQELRDAGVFSLPTNAVESLYYHPTVIQMVAKNLSAVTGLDSDAVIDKVRKGMLRQFKKKRDELCAAVVEQRLREKVLASLPKRSDIDAGEWAPPTINISASMEEVLARFDRLIEAEQLDELVMRFKVRRSGIPAVVAAALENKGPKPFERAVRKQLQQDNKLLKFVRTLVEPLCSVLLSDESN